MPGFVRVRYQVDLCRAGRSGIPSDADTLFETARDRAILDRFGDVLGNCDGV